VVILLAVAPTPLLLPRARTLWSLPALAPLLGVVALAPAFVALAGVASTSARRAGLGVAGFFWLAGAEAVTDDARLFGAPAAVPGSATWEASVAGGLSDAVVPYLTTPALLPALAFAGLAALLPLAVRGRSLRFDLARGAVWAGGLVAALAVMGDLLSDGGADPSPRGAVVGALLGVVAAVAVATLRTGFRERGPSARERPPAEAIDRRFLA
jgi:hypothetical protein